MLKRDEEGYIKVVDNTDGGWYDVAIRYWESLKKAWMNHEEFFECHATYGYPIMLKLSIVGAIIKCTPECIATQTEDEKANKDFDE